MCICHSHCGHRKNKGQTTVLTRLASRCPIKTVVCPLLFPAALNTNGLTLHQQWPADADPVPHRPRKYVSQLVDEPLERIRLAARARLQEDAVAGAGCRTRPRVDPALRSACWKTSPTIGSALRAPWPQLSPIVTRLSLKPTQAPATSCGCIRMNQPSVLSCVVPVLPATSAGDAEARSGSPRRCPRRPRRASRSPAPAPARAACACSGSRIG